MRYVVVFVLLVTLVTPQFSLATTPIPETSATLIQSLLEQVAILKKQVADLLAQKTSNNTPVACVDLSNSLMIGSVDGTTNNEVTKLQQFLVSQNYLAKDMVTGYYGQLTAGAVEKWQKAHGMDFVTTKSGVGPMTREKMRCATVPKVAIEKINWNIQATNPTITDENDYRKHEQTISIDVIRADKSTARYTVGNAYGCTGSTEHSTIDDKKTLGKVDCYFSLTGVTFTAFLTNGTLTVEKFQDDASGKTNGTKTTVLTI